MKVYVKVQYVCNIGNKFKKKKNPKKKLKSSFSEMLWSSFLTNKERTNLIQVAKKVEPYSLSIHGEKRTMFKWISSQNKIISVVKQKISQRLLCNCLYFHDCSFIFTKIKARPQAWHMDSLMSFHVINILLNSNIPTDFLDREQKTLCWSNVPKPALKTKQGDAIFFLSDTIHRGPANPTSKTRISLYITCHTTSDPITTDFTYPNWAWLDSHFEDATTLYRSITQIDFLILSGLYKLYPRTWFGEPIHDCLQAQIQKRNEFLQELKTWVFGKEPTINQYGFFKNNLFLSLETANITPMKNQIIVPCPTFSTIDFTESIYISQKICLYQFSDLSNFAFLHIPICVEHVFVSKYAKYKPVFVE